MAIDTTKDLTASPLKEKDAPQVPELKLTDNERTYLSNLKVRLQQAKDARDGVSDFFDGMTYITRCEQNRKLVNTYIRPKANKQDTAFSTGTARQKLMTLLAAVNNLNLKADITAFNEDNMVLSSLGEAIEDIIHKTEDLDNDDEKRFWREYVLLSQGEVFVEELWLQEFKTDKSIPSFNGKFRNVDWSSRLKKLFERPSRNIIKNEKVYLGDVTQPILEKQPFIFTLDVIPYQRAKAIYGKWENWEFVPRVLQETQETQDHETTQYNPHWALTSLRQDQVEVLKYQDPINNEFQILLSGIPMLPIGFPLPWKHDGYNLVMQILELMDPHFAYGKGLMQRLKTSQGLEDEFWRLALLKGQQSFAPPMANRTGKVLSSQAMMPGKMHYGIDPERLKPLIEANGPNQSEFNILELLRKNLDDQSISPSFQGQAGPGEQTATEVLELQRQSQMILGNTIFACAELERKLAHQRIDTILEHWFDPINPKAEDIRQKFRAINVEKPIQGRGIGQETVEIVENDEQMPSPFQLLQEEEAISRETGVPTRKIVLNKQEIQNRKLAWRATVNPTPKQTSNLQKLMFREELTAFSFSPNLSMDWAEEKAALVWGENPAKVFRKGQGQVPGAGEAETTPTGATPLGDQGSRVSRRNKPNALPGDMVRE